MSNENVKFLSETSSVPSVEQVIARYLQIRNEKSEFKAKYDRQIAELDMEMDRIESYLQSAMNLIGAATIQASAGTAYTSVRPRVSVTDWNVVLNWIIENEYWQALDPRISRSFVEAYKEEHKQIPPGVEWHETLTVNVRRNE